MIHFIPDIELTRPRRPGDPPLTPEQAERAQRAEDTLRRQWVGSLAPDRTPAPTTSYGGSAGAGVGSDSADAGSDSADAASLGLAIGAQALGNQQQRQATRREALADIGWQQARKLHAPVYGVQAAIAQRRMADNGGMNYLQPLLDHYRRGGFR